MNQPNSHSHLTHITPKPHVRQLLQQQQQQQQKFETLLRCPVCLEVFHRPVTSICGHTFCQDCLRQSLSSSQTSQCPICRLHISGIPRINLTLQSLVTALLPSVASQSSHTASPSHDHIIIPLFVLTGYRLTPGRQGRLRVFEPKYRLMVRRIIDCDPDKYFGIIDAVPRDFDLNTPILGESLPITCRRGVVCSIESFTFLQNGQIFIKIRGEYRFSCNSRWQKQSYEEASISRIIDSFEFSSIPKIESYPLEEARPLQSQYSSLDSCKKIKLLCTALSTLQDILLSLSNDSSLDDSLYNFPIKTVNKLLPYLPETAFNPNLPIEQQKDIVIQYSYNYSVSISHLANQFFDDWMFSTDLVFRLEFQFVFLLFVLSPNVLTITKIQSQNTQSNDSYSVSKGLTFQPKLQYHCLLLTLVQSNPVLCRLGYFIASVDGPNSGSSQCSTF